MLRGISRKRQQVLEMGSGKCKGGMHEERVGDCELEIAVLKDTLDGGRPCGCVRDGLEVLKDPDI
jgi:hypothetical protein